MGAGWQAVGELYHAYVTGLILTIVTRRSVADAAEFVFRIFRRQQLEKFLPGLEKVWAGALSIHDRRARLRVERHPPVDGEGIVWRIAR
jgi:hypothetical protein